MQINRFTHRVGRAVVVLFSLVALAPLAPAARAESPAEQPNPAVLTFPGKDGPGKGKKIVLISGDEEYRSEEGLPMLAKILSQRDGFTCTVLFSVDKDGTINPNLHDSLPGAEALDSADAIILQTRFRAYPDDIMKHFADAVQRGVPIVGLRTATHAFAGLHGKYEWYNEFGKHVFGEHWVDHWGRHHAEATRGIIEPENKDNPVLRGVSDVFGTTDVYEAHPPADATILLRGQVLTGMNPTDPPADYARKNQRINSPMMPIAWTRIYKNESGKENRVLCTTMGAATDLQNEGLRRMIVNAVFWGLGMQVPEKTDVQYVDDYHPSMYGFNGWRKGDRPQDHALGKALEPDSGSKGEAGSEKRPAAETHAGAQNHAGPAAALDLRKGDHIAIVGGTLPDRMQHDGWLETLIYAYLPKDDLVVRNLAAAGDEVNTWHRSENFGTRDDWLGRTKTDVIFAFYGFNESFKGEEGLPQFKQNLDKFVKETLARKYGDNGATRVVLFSPTALEHNRDPNIPDITAHNAVLQKYADAVAEVAKANNVPFVDLFGPSLRLYQAAAKQGESLTINGMHLTNEGDRLLAPEMFQSLFHHPAPSYSSTLEPLRDAINVKSEMWHSRYRTMDGYNIYGGRSAEAYQPDKGEYISNRNPPAPYVSNYQVMQEEMRQRDVLTSDRDKHVWSIAQGQDAPIVDNDLPPVQKVLTNHPGPNPDKTWPYLSGEAAIAKMTVPPHCKVNLFASEEQFPELVNPVQMAWDGKGRLWVAAWHNYPERTPTSTLGDSILIFEDTHHTGHADKCIHFIDGLNCPTGFQFYKDGILLMQAPDLWYVHDSKGGDHADTVERVLMGMDSADAHHTTNSMVLDPGGATYLSDGVFHRTQVETYNGPARNEDACIWRYEPVTGKFERYAPYGFANPHGRVFDYWGNDLITDATGNNTYFGPAISGHIDYPSKHPSIKQFWDRPSRPCPGTAIMTSKQFPEEFWGNFLNCNVISFQGIYRVQVEHEGSGLIGSTIATPLVSSTDPNFRPTAVNVGPDGAVYFADWTNDIIGHLQHHLRDPNRDHVHGRIYRMVYEGRPLEQLPQIAGAPIPALLDLLKDPQDQIRTLAKIELGSRDTKQVIAALDQWTASLDKSDKAYQHNLTEALWVHQWQNVVDEALLKRVLASPDANARAAATRVLCYWRDRVPDALALLKVQAGDKSPRVRLEAVRAASFFEDPRAVEVALESLRYPTDYYLDYVLKETMRQLDPYWKNALAQGKMIGGDNPAAADFLFKTIPTADLLKMPRNAGVLTAVVTRADIPDLTRAPALGDLAKLENKGPTALLLALMSASNENLIRQDSLAKLLPMQTADDLKSARGQLEELAQKGISDNVRAAAWAALATADGTIDKVWAQASQSNDSLVELLRGVPMIFKHDVRNEAYPKLKGLLAPTLPNALPGARSTPPVMGRYVRIELPHPGPLTLAEVQVYSEGKNVALAGKATQSTTAYGGEPSRAIDGRTDGAFSSGTETHTAEDDPHPWWEVDLGSAKPIESVVVWNRTESNGEYAKRLDGFTLVVLDGQRHEVFKSEKNPAPDESVRIHVGNDTAGALRVAAINAAVSTDVDQTAVFNALVGLIEKGDHVQAAAHGLRALPRFARDADHAAAAATALINWARAIPVGNRTNEEYVEAVQTAGELAGSLPPDRAAPFREQLKPLRVSIFLVSTVREQMRFDTARIVVAAGKPFEIIFQNSDFMPHNFVIVKPGTRPEIGGATTNMRPDQLDSRGRAFMPRKFARDIIGATRLTEPGQRETLKLLAPEREGDYEFLCTFPGHWQSMWGHFVVTKDVDAYLAAHPDVKPIKPTPAAGQ